MSEAGVPPPVPGRGSRPGSWPDSWPGSWKVLLVLLPASAVIVVWLLALPMAVRRLLAERYLQQGLYRLALAVLGWELERAVPVALLVSAMALVVVVVLRRRLATRALGLRSAWLVLGGALALLWLVLAAVSWIWSRQGAENRPDLVLLSVDTLRADRLGCYGNRRGISPNLDRIAGEGLQFERAVAPAAWTLPSMASVLTGLPALEHGAVRMDTALASRFETLPEVLANDGYRTVAVVSHVFVNRAFGLAQGFELFDDATSADHADVSSERLTRRALEHVQSADERPLFLWVHYFDPHYSYVRHPEYALALPESRSRYTWAHLEERARDLGDEGLVPQPGDPLARRAASVYDEEVAFTDHWIGSLLDGLRGRRPGRRTVVAILGDHGELFFEHGKFGHGDGVSQELIHVPLILGGDVDEGLRGVVVERTVSLAALPATFTALAGVERRRFPGPNLLRLARSGRGYGLPVFAIGGADGSLAALRGDLKLVRSGDSEESLYRLDGRGNEMPSSGSGLEGERRSLEAALDELVQSAVAVEAPSVKLPREKRELLRSLGYLE